MPHLLDTITAVNKEHLFGLIKTHMNKYGTHCDLNHIDVSRITDLSYIFSESKFIGDISKWDTSNVIYMDYMFYDSLFNGNISNWDTSNVTKMRGMFLNSPFKGDLSKWDVSNVLDMYEMFNFCDFRGDISNWNVSDECYLACMFSSGPQIDAYPRNGTLFWYFVLNGEIKNIDDIQKIHLNELKPFLKGLSLDGIKAAKYLHSTYQPKNLCHLHEPFLFTVV